MDYTAFSTMHQQNNLVKNELSNHNISLFDKNLHRINKNLEYVNEYYIPKYEHPGENHGKAIENQVSNEPLDEKNDQSINVYSEFHKIIMNEIEAKRKMNVRIVLNKKANSWEDRRVECSNKLKNKDEDSMRLIRERLAIDRNYSKELLDSNNDSLVQARLQEKQNTVDQKTRNIKNVLMRKVNEQFQNISEKSQFENFSFKIESHKNKENKLPDENLTFKINENNLQNQKLNKEEPEIKNFTFKTDENPEVKANEFFTFKFKTDEKIADGTIENEVKKENKNDNTYNFEDDYEQFLANHFSIQKYLKQIEKSYSSFLQDDSLKHMRQEFTKSINTPVNSISSVSPWHMKDKFDKLDSLLKCKTVKTGNSTVSAKSHQYALTFCKDTLAKKIINIGEQVASVKTETAFEVASIVTELWQVHPDFGLLLFARFKQKCPCLIPYNAAKMNEETDEEYYKSLGYNYTNGVVEKQDKFVKRMTGIIRLFAAIIVTETKSGKALGIGQAWMVIAATMNLIPQLDVTAVLLHEMLLITGYNLKQAYGRQFFKMLQYIHTNYMKKIDEVTPIGCGGPVQRLKTFISKVIQVGHIDRPKGVIPYNFW